MNPKGETLSEADFARARPIRGEGGKAWRAYCPFHGGDKQRSLRVDVETGRFQCFSCGVWGYTEQARQRFGEQLRAGKLRLGPTRRVAGFSPAPRVEASPPSFRGELPAIPSKRRVARSVANVDLQAELARYQAALVDSPGMDYLEDRGIPLRLAQRHGLGYAAPRQWAHRDGQGRSIRNGPFGRLVFPHTTPDGQLINLYGRALGDRVAKALRHDHLPGAKGYFRAPALQGETVYVCEGPFDALSLEAANPEVEAVAIFGVSGWRWDWLGSVRRFVFALDRDAAGQKAWRELAKGLILRGRLVEYLAAECYGGAKDINEAWVAGVLRLG